MKWGLTRLINIIFIFDIIFKVLDEWASESRVGISRGVEDCLKWLFSIEIF
jgi:hypothetical protein